MSLSRQLIAPVLTTMNQKQRIKTQRLTDKTCLAKNVVWYAF